MPDTCCVGGCPNVGTHGGVIRYYNFPKISESRGEEIQQLSQVRREQWIANIRVKRPEWEPHKSSKICSFHFISGQKADILDVKNPDWVPTLRMGLKEDENTELQRAIFVRRTQALISKSPPAIARKSPRTGKRNTHHTLLNKASHAKEDNNLPMTIRVRPPTHQRWEQARATLGLEDDDALARYFLNHFEAGCQSVQMTPTGEDSEDKQMEDTDKDTTSTSCLPEQDVNDVIDIPFSESCKTNKNANDVIKAPFTQKDTLLASTDSSAGKGENDVVPSILQTSQPISKEALTASGDIARDIIKMSPAQQQSSQLASKGVDQLVDTSVVLTSEQSSQLVSKDSNVKLLATDSLSMQHTPPSVNNLTNVGAVAAKPGVVYMSLTQQANQTSTQGSHTSAGILIANSTAILPNTPSTTGNNLPTYTCSCGKTFLSGQLLEKHKFETHGAVDDYKCNQCGLLYKAKNALTKHIARDHRGPPFNCSYCDDSFNDVHLFVEHQSKHYDQISNILTCDSCGRNFRDPKRLLKHKQDVHVKSEDAGDRQGFQCDHCGQVYKSKGALSKHKFSSCKNYKKGLPFSCLRCKKGFSDSSALVQHLKMHDDDINNDEIDDGTEAKTITTPLSNKITNASAVAKPVYMSVTKKANQTPTQGSKTSAGTLSTPLLRNTPSTTCDANSQISNIAKHRTFTKKPVWYSCGCQKRFISGELLEKHKLAVHGEVDKYKCKQCCITYRTRNGLTKHVGRDHQGPPFICSHCDEHFNEMPLLLEHQRKHVPPGGTKERTKAKKIHSCACGKRFSKGESYRRHQCVQRKECPHCSKTYKHDASLQIHIEVSHSANKPRFTCQKCGKVYCRLSNLHFHKKSHHSSEERKRWQCKLCSKSYGGKQALTDHQRKHTKQWLLCTYCGKEFTMQKNLRRHELIHRKEKRYRCTICHKAYYDSYKLKCHMYTHTGEKPLKCKYCGKGFVYSSARCLHQRTQHRDVEVKMETSDRETKQQESDESKGQLPSSLLEVFMSI